MANVSTVSGTGICKKCGTQKTTINDAPPICLNCDMPENKPSGLVVRVKDPGHTAMLDIEAGKQVRMEEKVQNISHITVNFSLDELDTDNIVEVTYKKICDALDEMPFTCMKDAKRVMKIQEKLEAK